MAKSVVLPIPVHRRRPSVVVSIRRKTGMEEHPLRKCYVCTYVLLFDMITTVVRVALEAVSTGPASASVPGAQLMGLRAERTTHVRWEGNLTHD